MLLSHSEHRFPAPFSKEGCCKPVLGVCVVPRNAGPVNRRLHQRNQGLNGYRIVSTTCTLGVVDVVVHSRPRFSAVAVARLTVASVDVEVVLPG